MKLLRNILILNKMILLFSKIMLGLMSKFIVFIDAFKVEKEELI